MKQYEMYVGGADRPATGGAYFDTQNPFTGEVWARIAEGGAEDVNAAVGAARDALNGAWGAMTASARGRLMMRLADLIEEKAPELGEIEVRDNGKLLAEMAGQTRYIAEWYRYFGGLADKIQGAVIPTDKAAVFNYTRREPVGVVAMITPWNSPLLLLAWKLAPALAAGCTAVVKPSEFTSASTLEFVRLFKQADFPDGVVNVVTGFGAGVGAALVEHPDIAKIAFTGSDQTGQKIYEAAARGLKHVSLELGGKSPNIVFEDADLEAAVMGAISGIFAATGQTCIAGSRLLLQRSIMDRFQERLVEVAGAARMGDPMSPETHVGPITTPPQYRKVLDYIAIARNEGARCILGGEPAKVEGGAGDLFIKPTIFTDVRNDMRIAQEEVFGPILAIIPFEDEAEATAIANDVDFGLAAGVWTSNIGRAFRMSEKLNVGTVWVNTYRAVSYTSPFGGTKRSGIGRESGMESVGEFLQTKSVWIATETTAANPFVLR